MMWAKLSVHYRFTQLSDCFNHVSITACNLLLYNGIVISNKLKIVLRSVSQLFLNCFSLFF